MSSSFSRSPAGTNESVPLFVMSYVMSDGVLHVHPAFTASVIVDIAHAKRAGKATEYEAMQGPKLRWKRRKLIDQFDVHAASCAVSIRHIGFAAAWEVLDT